MPEDRPGRIDPADLLGRQPVGNGLGPYACQLATKRLLVTGAGGFLGSALARDLAALRPPSLVLVDNHENSLAALRKSVSGDGVRFVLADIRDRKRMLSLLDESRPDVVFHLAAYKHVDLAEEFPEEYVAANVLATWRLAQAAMETGVERFVYPSSDKAVQPCSVYGATKRVAEILLRSLNAGQHKTQSVVVRLVNVVGASGSVIDTFARQIASGRRLTLTHPDMTRYWMTEGEALLLMGYGAASPCPGATIAVDVGEPVAVLQVAQRLWERYGAGRSEFVVDYIGTRPGERLAELLLGPTEAYEPSECRGILRIVEKAAAPLAVESISARLTAWESLAAARERAELRKQLLELAYTGIPLPAGNQQARG
ncbi:MAG: polysaccharide biosynthesis protein [Chloroflexi bacterium]|nr:polysaccharide biosynthesis protein [Chloroflexota bacterium]MCL5026623.1 polysaccharide biosynthesis protein [Chloroflexota bacterium]